MTIIVGFTHRLSDTTWLGGDAAVTAAFTELVGGNQ